MTPPRDQQSERKDGHSALCFTGGQLQRFDPHLPELLPCPHCGKQPHYRETPSAYWQVICPHCSNDRKTKEESAQAWNARVIPTPDKQGVDRIVEHASEVLQAGIRQDCNLPEFDGMAEFRRVITTALQSQSETGRQWNQLLELQLTNLQSLYTELNAAVVGYLEMRVSYEELLPHLTLKGEEESPAETSKTRNAALTAHDEALPGEWTWQTVRDYVNKEDGSYPAVAAAHNSALLVLVDALRKRFNDHILTCPDCSGPDEGCEEGQWLEQILQPYSTQKDGKL